MIVMTKLTEVVIIVNIEETKSCIIVAPTQTVESYGNYKTNKNYKNTEQTIEVRKKPKNKDPK